MAIDKKLIHFKTWNKFIEQIGGEANITTPTSGKEVDGTALYGQIKGTSIVFIKDVGKIWTHGNLYGENEIVIDDVLSDASENPVKGNVIKEYVDLHPQYESIDEIDVPELDLPMIECDSELSTTSIKPVQNRVVTQALNNKIDKVSGKQLSTEDFTTSLKNKLVGLKEFDPTEINNEINALAQQVNTKQNKLVSGTSIKTVEGQSLLGSGNISIPVPTVDAALSSTSTNAIQNKAVANALNEKQDTLVSGTNIKTINGESILGDGDIQVAPEITVDSSVSDTSTNPIQNKAIKDYVDSNIYEQRIIYSAENGTLTTSQRTYNAETYTKLINREKVAVYYSDFNNTPLIPLSVGSMNMMTKVITLVHYSGVAPDIATTTFELHSDGNVESVTILYTAQVDTALSSTSTHSVQNKVITAALNNKIDKVTGKGLSTEDFTTALKTKLEGLTNYDDAAIQNAVNRLTTQLNTLVNGDASTAIESFNEITAFLANVTDEESLEGIVAGIEHQISTKQDILVSGNTIKTINGQSILGEGDIEIQGVTRQELEEVEEITASALNELNEKKADKEYVEDALKNMDTSSLASKEELEALRNEVITNEEIVASSLNDLENRKADKEYVEDEVKNLEQYVEDALGNVSVDTSTLVTKEEFADVEEVWAASYNLLNQKISDVQQYIYDEAASRRQFDEAIAEIQTMLLENESVITAAWNQLNTRINAIEAAQAQGE